MGKLIHLFIPRESNNHKAKILHSSSLIVIASLFVVFQSLISLLPNLKPNILGYAAQISPEEVVRLTNQKRAEAGLTPLTYNQTLASAAYTKGRDMIDRIIRLTWHQMEHNPGNFLVILAINIGMQEKT